MKQSFFFYLVAICMLFTYCAPAKTKKKHKVYLKLVEAYTQRTVPGIPGPPPPTGTHLIVIWEASTAPETFFWRGDGGWLGCNMVKAHKSAKKAGGHARGADYYTESVMPEQVHKGDTLELSPVTGGKFPIPAEIPADAKNTLFFKTGGSTWLSVPVTTITKKADIVTP